MPSAPKAAVRQGRRGSLRNLEIEQNRPNLSDLDFALAYPSRLEFDKSR
jgi:hypothetical protein